LENSLVS